MAEEPARLRDLLEEAGRRLGLGAPVATGALWARWPELVGEAIAEHAQPTSLRAGVLRVRADSPAWATEIGYLSEQLRTAANRALGSAVVREVRVWTGPLERPGAVPGARDHTDRGTGSCDESRPPTDDPVTAFERARGAWARRVGRARGGPGQNRERPS